MSRKGAIEGGGVWGGEEEGGSTLVEEDDEDDEEEEEGAGPVWQVCGLTDLLPSAPAD